MLSLPPAWTDETGLPTEAGIQGLWDTSVPIISGTCTDTVCLSLPQHGPRKPISVPRCGIGTSYFVNRPERSEHGLRSGTGLTGRDFGDQGCVYAIKPQTELPDQSIIEGIFLLSRLGARVLFVSIAYACNCIC